MKHIVVIGAGPAGLSCAYEILRLARIKGEDVKVTLLEAKSEVGGLCRTLTLWDRYVDLGPHRFFTRNKRVLSFWQELAGEQALTVSRLTRIYFNKKFFTYPLRPLEALFKLGIKEACRCALSYLKARFQSNTQAADDNFEAWVIRRFGRRLYTLFFKSYSEKLWGIPCTMLDADFASQRIKGLNFIEALIGFLKGSTRPKTLIDRFLYPELGCGQVYARLKERFLKLGGRLRLNCEVLGIKVVNNKVQTVKLADGEELAADVVVSSMPLTDLMLNSEGIPASCRQDALALHYRNTTLVYLRLKDGKLFPDNWIYVHDEQLKTGRITNFNNWSVRMLNGSLAPVLSLEYWSDDKDSLWQLSESDLIKLAKEELYATSLVPHDTVMAGKVVRLEKSYPVYKLGYKEHLGRLKACASKIAGLYCIGRNGSFKYNNQDHSLLMGLLAAENIMKGTRHDLWSVNTDSAYQEGEGKAEQESDVSRGEHDAN